MTAVLTMKQIRELPATVDAETGGAAFGISRSTAYEALRRGTFPARAIKVNGTWRIITASILEVLEGKAAT